MSQNEPSNEHQEANVLDLTLPQTLFELAIEEKELLGPVGAKLIADLKEKAQDAEYTHLYYRDPIRPGIIWFSQLGDMQSVDELGLPTRGKLDHSRRVTERVFPGFLKSVEAAIQAEKIDWNDSDDNEADNQAVDRVIMAQIPPLTNGVSGLELAVALEYLVFIYPSMVRAWATLIFTYAEILGLKEGAESSRHACIMNCPYAQIALFLMGEVDSGATEFDSGGAPEDDSIL